MVPSIGTLYALYLGTWTLGDTAILEQIEHGFKKNSYIFLTYPIFYRYTSGWWLYILMSEGSFTWASVLEVAMSSTCYFAPAEGLAMPEDQEARHPFEKHRITAAPKQIEFWVI